MLKNIWWRNEWIHVVWDAEKWISGNFMQRHVLCTDMFIVLGMVGQKGKAAWRLQFLGHRWELILRIDPYSNVGPVFQRNIQHVSLPLQRNLTRTRACFLGSLTSKSQTSSWLSALKICFCNQHIWGLQTVFVQLCSQIHWWELESFLRPCSHVNFCVKKWRCGNIHYRHSPVLCNVVSAMRFIAWEHNAQIL